VRLELPAPRLGVRHGTTYVYLPPGYSTGTRRYPVLYLLHGAPGAAADWFREGRAARIADRLVATGLARPVIVVAPSTNDGLRLDHECLDAPGGPLLETYLSSYVVSAIDARFRTVVDRRARAIGGYSAGADCALDIGLHHLGEFSVILAFTATGEPGPEAWRAVLHRDTARYRADAPFYFIPAMTFSAPVTVFLDSGDANRHLTERASILADELRSRGQRVVVHFEHRYGHSWSGVRAGFAHDLGSVTRLLGEGSAGPAGSA
jgi:S-formylglutathione hydrolase FrmB